MTAGGKGYSAGAIFLQVVPVFRNVQDAIKDEAKTWDKALGDQLEDSGDKAGQRAGKAASKSMSAEMEKGLKGTASDMEKALGAINTRNLGKSFRAEVKAMRADLDSLSEVDLKVDDNFAAVAAKLKALRSQIEGMRTRSKVFFDIEGLPQVYRKIKEVETAVGRIDGTVSFHADTKPVDREMSVFEKKFKETCRKAARALSGEIGAEAEKLRDEIKYLENLRVGIDISSGQARKEIGEVRLALERLGTETVEPDIKIGSLGAMAELAAFEASVRRVDGRDVDVDVDVDTGRAIRGLGGVTRSSDDAANSFRSFNGILLAAVALGPALVPVLGAIAGGLLAVGPAAGVAAFGLGSVIVGFSGLGDALTAMQSKQDAQATTAQTSAKQNRSAGQAIQDAARGVADAERNAAQAAQDAAQRVADARKRAGEMVENALDRQREAQRRYRDSVEDVRLAEQALRDARRAAAGMGDDISRRVKSNKLAQDQALIDEFNTTVRYNAVQNDGASTNLDKEQARIDRDEAKLRMETLRAEGKELAAEQRKWNRDGVNGTDQVRSAQENLNEALAAQRDAYRATGEAAAAVDDARREGAEGVSEAVRAQNRTLADNARALERAREGLARARQGSEEVATAINSQDAALQAAMDKLGPAGRKFALFLFSLREGFRRVRDDIQEALLPPVQRGIQGFIDSPNAGVAKQASVGLAGGFGQTVEEASGSLQGDAWGGFFKMLRDVGPDIQSAYGTGFIKFLEAMASIMTTLAPYALSFARGFERMMTAFAGWAASKDGAAGLERFMDHMAKIGPSVLKFFGLFFEAAANLLVALAPYSEVILEILTAFLSLIAGMDPKVLGAFVGGLLALITASQIAYAVMNLLLAGTALLTSSVGMFVFLLVGAALAIYYVYKQNETLGIILGIVVGSILGIIAAVKIWTAIMFVWRTITMNVAIAQMVLNGALLANPIGLVILAIIALVVAIVLLWRKSETFRNIVISVWEAVKTAFSAAWDFIKPILGAIGDAFVWLWRSVIKPAFKAIGHAVRAVFKGIGWAWENILWPVIKFIAKWVWKLWKIHFKIVFVLILALVKSVFIAIKTIWRYVLKPIFEAIGVGIKWLWKNAFKPALGEIKRDWDRVSRAMRWVWRNVLKPIFDAFSEHVLPRIKKAFKSTVEWIGDMWGRLKKWLGKPVEFVVNTVLRDGLIKNFNKVAKWVGQDGFEFKGVDFKYATGGVLPGYTPGRDVHHYRSANGTGLHLSGGEAIMRPEWTRAVGKKQIDEWNRAARAGGAGAVAKSFHREHRFASGGVMPKQAPGRVHPTPYYGAWFATDFPMPTGTPVHAWKAGRVARAAMNGNDGSYGNVIDLNHIGGSTRYAHLSRILVQANEVVRAAQVIGLSGSTGNSTGPHLHMEIRGQKVPVSLGNGTSGPSLPGWLSKLAGMNPVSWLMDKAKGVIGKLTDKFGDNPFVETITSIPLKVARLLKDKITGYVDGATVGNAAATAGLNLAMGGPAQTQVKKVAERYGWDSGTQWRALVELVQRESSWNPSAANPNTSARGLFQKMTSLHGPVERTAAAQAAWGLNYIRSRYGTPTHALSYHNQHNSYAEGGILDKSAIAGEVAGVAPATAGMPYNGTMMYDSGGYLPPGLTTVVNLTGKPEPVFTADQFSGLGNGNGGGGWHYEPHFEGSDLTPGDVADDLNFAMTSQSRRGKRYGGGNS